MIEVCRAPCFSCGTYLRNFEPEGGNHPLSGLEFVSPGHYGSRLFDMQDGVLVINVCDDCLSRASGEDRVLHRTRPAPRRPKDKFKLWRDASCDTQPEAGDVEQAPLVSGAVTNEVRQAPIPDHSSETPVE